MKQAHRRHDISDRTWALIEPRLMGGEGARGGNGSDNRQFINAVAWILSTGAPWRGLPHDLGDWKSTHSRFCRWRDKGAREGLLEILLREPDCEWLTTGASHIKVHQHGAGARGGNHGMDCAKGGSTRRYTWPWTHMACLSEPLSREVPSLIAHRLASSWRG
jgi:transposase